MSQTSDSRTAHMHGTHVTGLAIAEADNGIGIAGVAPDASYMSINASADGAGSFTDDALREALDFAIAAKAHVINLSAGRLPGYALLDEATPGPMPWTLDILDDLIEHDIVMVGVAGNFADPGCAHPASHPNVLCVVATDVRENLTWYSGRGLTGGPVIAAPGGAGYSSTNADAVMSRCDESIVSLMPATTPNNGNPCDITTPGDMYGFLDGTSQAAPLVSGVALLVRAMGCDAPSTIAIITETARPPSGAIVTPPGYGAGIVDAAAAVALASTRC